MNTITSYHKDYLEGNNKLTSYMHVLFTRDLEYDALSLMESYMNSRKRELMDRGNVEALYNGSKQLYNGIDKNTCIKNASKNTTYDLNIMRWMGKIYSTIQWLSRYYSKDICTAIPPQMLYNSYEKYKDLEIMDACEELYNEYLQDKDFPFSVTEDQFLDLD